MAQGTPPKDLLSKAEQIALCVEKRAAGEPIAKIAQDLGLTRPTVYSRLREADPTDAETRAVVEHLQSEIVHELGPDVVRAGQAVIGRILPIIESGSADELKKLKPLLPAFEKFVKTFGQAAGLLPAGAPSVFINKLLVENRQTRVVAPVLQVVGAGLAALEDGNGPSLDVLDADYAVIEPNPVTGPANEEGGEFFHAEPVPAATAGEAERLGRFGLPPAPGDDDPADSAGQVEEPAAEPLTPVEVEVKARAEAFWATLPKGEVNR